MQTRHAGQQLPLAECCLELREPDETLYTMMTQDAKKRFLDRALARAIPQSREWVRPQRENVIDSGYSAEVRAPAHHLLLTSVNRCQEVIHVDAERLVLAPSRKACANFRTPLGKHSEQFCRFFWIFLFEFFT